MKTYTFTQLKALCPDQGYKLARLENSQGEAMTSYNKIKVPISKQFTVIQQRLKSDILPDGIYYVCLAPTINKSSNPDRYPIVKGKANNLQTTNTHLNENQNQNYFQMKQESLLSSENAIKMLTEISDLKAQVKGLQLENQYLQEQLDEQDKEGGMGEDKMDSKSQLFSMLSEQAPALIGGLSEYFKLENRKVDLREQELKLKKQQSAKKPEFQKIVAGSEAHLAVIEMYAKRNDEKKWNIEMEKLQKVNPELYDQLVTKYTTPKTEEEEEEGGDE